MSFQIQKALLMFLNEYADLHLMLDQQDDTDDQYNYKLTRGYPL